MQAAPTGFSAVIDDHGDVLARTALAVRGVVVRDVALRDGTTLYERGGDLSVLLAAALAVLGGWALSLTGPDRGRVRAATYGSGGTGRAWRL